MRALLLAFALSMLPAAALCADRAEGVPMTAEEAAEARLDTRERDARDQLQNAKLSFQRGDFERAVQLFDGIIGTPVALRTTDELHDGFLHYAFTLFLMGDKVTAGGVLRTALKLKPEFVPSPVTTRPDLKTFYDEQRRIFLAEGGTAVLPGELFPELAGSRFVKTRRELPLPLLGVRLRQLGRPALANALLTVELTSGVLNAAGWILWGTVFTNLRPTGEKLRTVFTVSNPITFGIFWGAIAVELVATAVLDRSTIQGEDVAFSGLPDADALRRESASLDARRRARLRVRPGANGLVLEVW